MKTWVIILIVLAIGAVVTFLVILYVTFRNKQSASKKLSSVRVEPTHQRQESEVELRNNKDATGVIGDRTDNISALENDDLKDNKIGGNNKEEDNVRHLTTA